MRRSMKFNVPNRPISWLFRCEATSDASFRRRIIVLEWQRRELWLQVPLETRPRTDWKKMQWPPDEMEWAAARESSPRAAVSFLM
jgi:hypothetical protein